MEFITFKENNKKENESFIFFLQYTNNEEALKNLFYYVNKADADDLNGDFSSFEIDIENKISEKSVYELEKVHIGIFGPLFTVCKGSFSFNKDIFEKEDESNWALKLDELYYACRISDHFKQNNEKRLSDFQNIMTAWMKDTNTNDIYHMILDLLNEHKNSIINGDLLEEILQRMNSNDETKDIVEDFVYGDKYFNLRKELSSI
jgi:hypothetical protein